MIDLETSLFQQVVCDVICRKLEQEVRKTGRERVASFSPHFSQEAFHGLSSPKKCSAFGKTRKKDKESDHALQKKH